MCFPWRGRWSLDSAALSASQCWQRTCFLQYCNYPPKWTDLQMQVHCCRCATTEATPLSGVISKHKRSLQDIKGKRVGRKDAKEQLTNYTWRWNGINPWKRWSKAGDYEFADWGFWVRCVMLLAGKYAGFVRVAVKLRGESSGTRPSRGWKMGEQQPSWMKVRR